MELTNWCSHGSSPTPADLITIDPICWYSTHPPPPSPWSPLPLLFKFPCWVFVASIWSVTGGPALSLLWVAANCSSSPQLTDGFLGLLPDEWGHTDWDISSEMFYLYLHGNILWNKYTSISVSWAVSWWKYNSMLRKTWDIWCWSK